MKIVNTLHILQGEREGRQGRGGLGGGETCEVTRGEYRGRQQQRGEQKGRCGSICERRGEREEGERVKFLVWESEKYLMREKSGSKNGRGGGASRNVMKK